MNSFFNQLNPFIFLFSLHKVLALNVSYKSTEMKKKMSEQCNLLCNQFSAVFQRMSSNSEHIVNSFNQSGYVALVKKAGKKVTDSGQKHNMRVLPAKLGNSSP